MLVHCKKTFPSPFSLARNTIYLGTQLEEELIDLFWKLPGYGILYWAIAEKTNRGVEDMEFPGVLKK